jgi:hypothetical protein
MAEDVEVREQPLSVEVAEADSSAMAEDVVAMAPTTVRGTSVVQELADTQDEVQTHLVEVVAALLHPMVVEVEHLGGIQAPKVYRQAAVWAYLVKELAAVPLVMVFLEA